MNKSNFYNKKILITGASKGLGLVCAQSFLKLGAKVYLCGRDVKFIKKIKKKYKKKTEYFIGDLTQQNIFENFVQDVKRKLKKIDIIIHCMGGGLGFKNPLLHKDQFIQLHQVNIGVASEINRCLIGNLNKKKSFILHVGSTASIEAIGSVGYNTIKASIIAYVKSIASHLIRKNIYVTGILPGAFEGPDNSFVRLKKKNYKAYKNFISKKLPRGRISQSQELIPLISLLCSEEGSMLAGSSISIDACETKAYNFF